jgi:2-polyprenyl-6-hydroxyphenyl methylase/3-demethylubiquinone-9 3-methyltransferase
MQAGAGRAVTPGAVARKLLGPRFKTVGEFYRAVFVDLHAVAAAMDTQLPPGARCLDVGGGDGALADILLRRRADLRMTMIDLAPEIGGFLGDDVRDRVVVRPATALSRVTEEGGRFDALILADVMHPVPREARPGFLADLRAFCETSGCRLLILKDVEPGGLRARLSYLSDHHVTGDKGVSLIGAGALEAQLRAALGSQIEAVEHGRPDPPNYCLTVRLRDA